MNPFPRYHFLSQVDNDNVSDELPGKIPISKGKSSYGLGILSADGQGIWLQRPGSRPA